MTHSPLPEANLPGRVVSITVNGETIAVEAADEDTLLHVLRNKMGLKGSRFGCGAESCGACMVLVDGIPSYGCTTRAVDIGGRSVTTVEGLALAGADILLQAFLEEQAGQCGYCLSGILMSATALLAETPAPSRAEVVRALDKHLCRCGAHNRIIRAVLRAAASREAGIQ